MRGLAICSLALIVLLVFGAIHLNLLRAQQLQSIGLPKEQGWGDITLPITQSECASPSDCMITALGLHNGQKVGIQIRIHDVDPNRAFQADPSKGGIKAIPNGVVFTSLGDPTSQLIKLMASLYEHPADQISLPKQVFTTAITLQGDTSDLQHHAARIKIFHDDDNPDGPFYFEFFINVDLPHKTIELAEKDPDYRKGVLRSFGVKVE